MPLPTGPFAWLRTRTLLLSGIALAAPVYLSLLLSSPGDVAGDTKLYLYLDPGRLINDSLWTWDTRQFGGWVPHQNVGYVWPTGPWFALFDLLGIPDWIAQRLWLGTIMALAGLGCLWFGRRLGLSSSAAFIAATVYEFSPYVLPYISRTSALLLPWALLPWMCGVAMIAGRRWLAIAAFGFLVLSSGGLNATALLMIAPGPAIWIIHQWRTGLLSSARAVRTVALLGVVSLAMSAWWLAGLFVQGRFGAAVLSYSESLVSTAATSSAPEVLRGLGYWLFYDRNDVVALTSASAVHQESLAVLAAGGVLVLVGLWGILGDRTWRWPLMTMVLLGTVLAVGPHPFDDPSPLWSLAAENPKSALSLALRSSTRAVPLIILALALGTGCLVERRRQRNGSSRSRSRLVPLSLAALVVINAPAVVSGDLIDPTLTRPESLPQAWYDAASLLDERFDAGYTGAVLLVPGIESAAYRWGYPVDPILPGLTKKPFLSRDWLPLGSAPMMDLLFALDDSFQSGTASAASVAVVARLLGADTVMVVTSHQYERFGTVRPEAARAILGETPPGLRLLATFGRPTENRALDRGLERWSEDVVAHPPQEQPEILLYAVEDPSSPVRVSDQPVVVAADGSGLVDLAAQGLLTGSELTLAEAALDDDNLRLALRAAPEVIVTDSNRRRAHHWRSSQEVWGATEPLAGVLLQPDLFDSRLPVFPDSTDDSQSIVADPAVLARASSYGPVLTYWPEYRPAMAVDGDIGTSWRVGVDANPVGDMITLDAGTTAIERLRLVQPLDESDRWITAVEYRLDDGPWTPLSLGPSSRTSSGQTVDLPEPATAVTLRIADVEARLPFDRDSGPGVGFAEILETDRASPEYVRVPQRIDRFVGGSTPVTFAFTRWRSDPLTRWRQDPENSLRRVFTTTTTDSYEPVITARLSSRIGDSEIASVLGLTALDDSWSRVDSDGRLQGSPQWWAGAAIDGNPRSVWWTDSFGDPAVPTDSRLSIPITSTVSQLTLRQVVSEQSSIATEIRLEAVSGGRVLRRVEVPVPPPDVDGTSRLEFPTLSGERLDIVITAIAPRLVRDDVTGRVVAAPVGVADIASPGDPTQGVASPLLPMRLPMECRDDLLFIDAEPIPVRINGSVEDALAGTPLSVSLCQGETVQLAEGRHRLESSSGSITGWDIDTVVLRSASRRPPEPTTGLASSDSRGRRSVESPSCRASCWVEFPDGWNEGWQGNGGATTTPVASAAGRNTWVRGGDDIQEQFTVTWTPQRFLWWGLTITGVTTVLLCAAAVADVTGRLRRRVFESRLPGHDNFRLGPTPLIILILGTTLIDPIWGVCLSIVGLVLSRRPRALALTGWAMVSLSMAFLVAQQIRTGAEPGFFWPSVFARAHRPAMAGVIMSWCGVMILDRLRSDTR